MNAPHRAVTARDFDAALTTLADAFDRDPVWGAWAFPAGDRARLRRELFAMWLREAIALDSVRAIEGCDAVAMWYPPGSAADTDEYRGELRAYAAQLGAHADTLVRGAEVLSRHRPAGRYWYLALLAVRGSRRGQGIGLGLLRSCLESPEFRGLPAYLESTNPDHTPRYRRLGFAEQGAFELPQGPMVTRMWRAAESTTHQETRT